MGSDADIDSIVGCSQRGHGSSDSPQLQVHVSSYPRQLAGCRGWRLKPGEVLAVTGNIKELGSWQASAPLAMSEVEDSCWQAEVHSVPALAVVQALHPADLVAVSIYWPTSL